MVPSDGTMAAGNFLLAVNSNHVSICSSLAAIVNEKFQAISGRISETVRDRAKLTIGVVHK